MSVVFTRLEGQTECSMVFTKGAVERIVDACTSVLWEVSPDPQDKALEGANLQCNEVERDLCFLGLIGLYDLLCPETAGAICACYQAGIAVHMVMGDHPGTAKAIAQQVGMVLANLSTAAADVADVMVMTAGEFDKLMDDNVNALPTLLLIIARCAPQTKFAAMTGNGVNDSPLLKHVDVGIAIGQADDNLASILEVVKEGRCIFDNIEKFMLYLLSKNIAQSVFLLAPVEILWIIIITSGMPDIGLGMEIATLEIMDRPPQIKQAALCLSSFSIMIWGFGNRNLARGCNNEYSADCDLAFSRYLTQWMFDIWRNQFLFWSIVAGSMTTFPIIYILVLNHVVFKHTGISWEWGIVFVEAVLFFLGVELWKFSKRVYFRQRKESPATGNEREFSQNEPQRLPISNTDNSISSTTITFADNMHDTSQDKALYIPPSWQRDRGHTIVEVDDAANGCSKPSLGARDWEITGLVPLFYFLCQHTFLTNILIRLARLIVRSPLRAVEVDLVFPRNETYSPAEWFRIVFAVLDPQSAELLNLRISYDIRKNNNRNNQTTLTHDLHWANWSSSADPYLTYHSTGKAATRKRNRDEKVLPSDHDGGVFEHYYSWWQHFTIDDSALKKVDLVAATANATCPGDRNAIAINVTDTTMHSPPGLNSAGRDTCVVTATTTASATRTTPDPCRVAIDADAEASMAAVHQKLLCDHLKNSNPPEVCPAEENGAQQLAALAALVLSTWPTAASANPGFRKAASPRYRSSVSACPERYSDAGPNTGNWSVYADFKLIHKCKETMFYDFSLFDDVDDQDGTHRIQACSSYGPDFASLPASTARIASAEFVDVEFELGWWYEGFGLAASGLRSIVKQLRRYAEGGHGPTGRPFIIYGQSG
ncbi:hypothetical protein KXV55_001073 [Aspergillus fumigatus]|nr:hypothetical protein KXV55_001073 [Aspergillus fumigatus]